VDDDKMDTVDDKIEDDLDLQDFELDDDFDDIAGVMWEVDDRNYYNLSITYDNYFRTPRLWLIGFDSSNYPLSNNKIYKDISMEHSKITVTIEYHPFYKDIQYISVHPCKHSHVMKRLLEEAHKNGKEIGVEKYFLYFLKFVSTVMPNLDFDRTKIQ
jgi:ubiquitin-like-conjugating enzyme ATG3